MNSIKTYKTITYIILAIVVLVSFAITNLLLSTMQITGHGIMSILYIIINLALSFGMFFIVFRLTQIIIEKEAAISELTSLLNSKNETEKVDEEVQENKEQNIDELIEIVVPQSPQNMTIEEFTERILSNSAKVCDIVLGLFYIKNQTTGIFEPKGKYAYYSDKQPSTFTEGETISGQVAKNKKILNITDVPDNYFVIVSGLGKGNPRYMLVIPILHKDETIAIIEIASFKPFEPIHEKLFEKVSTIIGKILLKIK